MQVTYTKLNVDLDTIKPADEAGSYILHYPHPSPIVLLPHTAQRIKMGILFSVPSGIRGTITPFFKEDPVKYPLTFLYQPQFLTHTNQNGELVIIAMNLAKRTYTIKPGDPIGLLSFASYTPMEVFDNLGDMSELHVAEPGALASKVVDVPIKARGRKPKAK